MPASDPEALRLEIGRLRAENERLRQLNHQAGVDAALAAVRSAETEERLRALLDSATDYAILTTDERGFVTSWNEGAWRFLGWPEDEIVGRDGRVIFTPEDREEGIPEQERQTASSEGRAEDERWHLRKDGSRFWGSGVAMPLRGGSGGFLKILRDRTEHLHASRNQTRRLDQMRALAEAARTVVGAPDLPTTLQVITDAARDIIGAHQAVCSITRGPDWSQAITAVSLSEKYAAWRAYDRMTDGTGIYAWICEGNRTVRMTQAELEAHHRWRGFGEHAREHPPMRGWLAAPLVGSDGRNLGLIQLSDKMEGEFDQADEAIVVQLAQFAASAIERAQAVEELRSHAEFTTRILAASSDCIKVLDLDARLQFMSAGGRVIMEVDDFEQVRGAPWPGFWSGPERAAAEAAVEAAKAGREGRLQGFTPTAKGTPKWWDVVVTPISGADGRPERLLSVSRDITRERTAQQAVIDSEARLRSVFEIRTVGVMFWGEGFRLTDMNEAFLRMTGFTREEALGKTWPELTPEEFHPASRQAVHEVATRGETTPYEKQYFRKDGSRWWGLFAARKIGDEVVEFVLDISDRKEAEAALQASRERFQAAVEAVEGILWTNNARGEMVGEQPGWASLTGQAYDEYQGFGWSKAVHPDDVQPTIDAWLEAVAGKKTFVFEHRVRRHDGAWRLFSVRAIPALDPDGSIREWVGVHTDVTERKSVEAALRESEARLSQERARLTTLVDNLPVGVCFLDRDGKALLANPAFRRFLPDQPMPSRMTDGEERWRAWDENGQRLPRHGYPGARALRGEFVAGIEFLHRSDEGRETWTRVSGIPLREDGDDVVGALVVLVDIDEQKRAQEALQGYSRGLEREVAARTAERDRIWENSNELMAVFSNDGRRLAVNPAWSRVLGYDEEDLLDKPMQEITHPDDREDLKQAVRRLMQGKVVDPFEDRLRHANGSYRTISWTGVPGDGVFYAIGRDVTEQRRTEEALRQAQKMEAIGQLTGGVAHDFNNLLTIIRSSVEFLHRPDLPEARRRRYIDAISETVERAAKLTSQLLAFARRQALRPEEFDVAARVRSVTDMLRTIAGSRIQIATEIGCDPCYAKADMAQFETALVNMAVNARDAMEGEGRLTVRLAEAVEIPARRSHGPRPGRFLAVSLADTGSGIPADKLPHIFEPFFTTKEVGKGTGLGLSQVYGFARQSGGDVTVESEVGRGTTFTLYLPQADSGAAPEPMVEDEREPAEHGQGRRVLVVEDNVEVGTFSTQLLQDLGYETVWAANADEALKLLGEGARFDVVFSDVVMPGMSGLELGHEIGRRHPGLPVVLTSGYSHVLAQEGPHGFELLQKPYAAAEVSRVLQRVLEGRRRAGGR